MTGRRKAGGTHGQPACTVEVSSSEVDAGAEFTVRASASCPHGCDLKGQSLSIRNQDGKELACAELAESDGEAYATRAVVVRSPLEVGEHAYRAVLPVSEMNDFLHEEISVEFSVAAKAHAASVNVWGVPSAIAAGERFKFKAGIKCSSGCRLTGREMSVFDHEGAPVGMARLRDDVWPGTSALYFVESDAEAPLTPGDYEWRVETPGADLHAAGSCTFAIKIVNPPDCEVTVEAWNRETQTPIAGAHVLLHPYRALTDGRGVAKVKVAEGRYKLVVSGFNYIAHQTVIDVTDDVTTRAELAMEPEGQEDFR